jgi:predicted unusual protein kinase regulating ubiquinone biosynthesis (AarF/ABC1/UbiB family)
MTKKYPSNKLSRIGNVTKTAAKVAGKHALHIVTNPLVNKDKKAEKESNHYQEIGKEIFKAVSTLKGTALKAAQLLSLEGDLLPKEIQEECHKACYQVPPLNRAIVRKVIKNQFNLTPESLFQSFEPTAFAAASIGQVHLATTKKGTKVAVKIQYPGIDKTIQLDISVLKGLFLKLPIPNMKNKKAIIKTVLTEIENRFIAETNYEEEKANMEWFHKYNPFPNLIIPQPIKEHCTKTVLTMNYIEGDHLEEWLKKNPTQKEKNQVAQTLWDTFAYFFIKHHTLHADPNPGNYMILPNGKVGLLDFGCIKRCDPEFPNQLATMLGYYKDNDMPLMIEMLQTWGLISKKKSTKEIEKSFIFFRNWITTPFQTKVFDFAKHPEYMAQRFTKEFRAPMEVMDNTNHNFVMFDRTYMGLLRIFETLQAQVNISFNYD